MSVQQLHTQRREVLPSPPITRLHHADTPKAASTGVLCLHSTELCACKGKVLIAQEVGGFLPITFKSFTLTFNEKVLGTLSSPQPFFWPSNLSMSINVTFLTPVLIPAGTDHHSFLCGLTFVLALTRFGVESGDSQACFCGCVLSAGHCGLRGDASSC